MIKEVLLIFKTHLDIGFTDYAAPVTEKYLHQYLPAAIRTAREQENTPYPFVWTTGTWLIEKALKEDDGTLEAAIRDGLIRWHALPFTMHTEYMNEELLEYGLDICARLDARFGKKTVSAKMTDVPGHTAGLIRHLAARGIEFLHIGVNTATPAPNVPPVFRWKWGDDSIAVIYNKDYGEICEVGDTAVAFGFTGDNLGPQGGDQLKAVYDELQEKYPGAKIRAASLDDVAPILREAELPVIEAEIADNWIHGMGTDPTKTRAFRALLRCGKKLSDYDLTENLLLVPEHTWGTDLKGSFHNETDWTWRQIDACDTTARIEGSWAEQREYVWRAAEVMGVDLTEELAVPPVQTEGLAEIEGAPSLTVSYQLFDWNDYLRYKREYLQRDIWWAHWDFLKMGLPAYEGGIWNAAVTGAWQDGGKKIFRLEFDLKIRDFAGLPTLYVIEEGKKVEIRWFGKKNNRLPEAFWVRFADFDGDYSLLKLGQWIDPANCVGMKNLHCVWAVKNADTVIETVDAPLAAPFGRNLLQWNNPTESQELYFNLYNNVWNTNFPMWFSDDAKFRFTVHKG